MYEASTRRALPGSSSIAAFFPDRVETNDSKSSHDSLFSETSDKTYDSRYKSHEERKYQLNSRKNSTLDQYSYDYESRSHPSSAVDKNSINNPDHKTSYNRSPLYHDTNRYAPNKFDQKSHSTLKRDNLLPDNFVDRRRSDRNYNYPGETSDTRSSNRHGESRERYHSNNYSSFEKRRDPSLDKRRDQNSDKWRDRSLSRQNDRSYDRLRNPSPNGGRNRSPDRRRNWSPDRRRDRSSDRRRDRSSDRRRDRSSDRRRDRSSDRRHDRSSDRRHDRSPDRRNKGNFKKRQEESYDKNHEEGFEKTRERESEKGLENDSFKFYKEPKATYECESDIDNGSFTAEENVAGSYQSKKKTMVIPDISHKEHDVMYQCDEKNLDFCTRKKKHENSYHQVENVIENKVLLANSSNGLIRSISVENTQPELLVPGQLKELKQRAITPDKNFRGSHLLNDNHPSIKHCVLTPGYTPPQKHPQPELPSRKEFRVSYDPETAKDKTHGTKLVYLFGSQDPKESGDSSSNRIGDPRCKYSSYPKVSKNQRLPFKALFIPKFSYDSSSLGPKPPSQILISGLSNLTIKQTIARFFKAYGEIEEIELFQDNTTGMSLGLCRVRYKGFGGNAIHLAHESATRAVNEGCLLKIDMKRIQVQFDDTGELGIKLREKIVKGRQMDFAISKAPSGPRSLREEQKHPSSSTQGHSISGFVEKKVEKESSLRSKKQQEKITFFPATSDQEYFHSLLECRIGKKPFIRIKNRYAPTDKFTRADIQKFLRDFDIDMVLNDTAAFYIIFKSSRECKECYNDLNGRLFYDSKMYMDLFLSGYTLEKKDSMNTCSHLSENSVFSKSVHKKYNSPLEEARDIIMKDIRDHLMRDIREKVSAPALFENLDPAKFKEKIADLTPAIFEQPKFESASEISLADNEIKTQGSLQLLRRFKRKGTEETDSKKLKKRMIARPMNHRLNFDYSEDDQDTDVSTRKSTPTSFELEDDLRNNPNESAFRKRSAKKQSHVLYSSSDIDEATDTEDSKALVEKTIGKDNIFSFNDPSMVKDHSKAKKLSLESNSESAEKSSEKEEQATANKTINNIMEGKIDIIDEVKQFMDWPPSTGDSKPVYEDDFSLKLDLDGLQNLVKDDEDIDLIRSVLADTNIANIGDHKYWSWRSKEVKSYNHGFKKVGTVGMETDLYDQFRHTTGSSRSQGYYKVIEADKSIYLPHRRKIHQPIDTLHVNDKSQDATKGIPSSRLNRANNRRLAADINIHKQTFSSETDIFNFNQLMKRRKPVKFARSAIHNWGLYAIEPIAANEMIIEYVGETVRQQVADIRENKYLSSGIGSSYLFRIDENTVVDATKRGGIARFINHCCTPSCTAKIIKVEGSKRIVIYALRDIAADEELTYDYKFEREQSDDERIVCLCGAIGCKGYLN